jgi:hypothetical protein
MRFLIIVRSRHRVKREEFPALVAAFAAWREQYRSVSESFEAFVGGKGGFGVVDVEDEATLHRMMIEYPFGPTSDYEIQALVPGDQAIAMWQEMAKAMMAES